MCTKRSGAVQRAGVRLTSGPGRMAMSKYSVHIPEQTILVDGDLRNGDPLAYWEENGRSLIMWDIVAGAFSQMAYTFQRISD
jgi:hypothetical protein